MGKGFSARGKRMCKVPAKGRHLQKNWEKVVWLPQRERRGEVRFQGRQGWLTQPSGNSGNQPEAFQTCDCNKALCQALWRNQRPFKSWGKKNGQMKQRLTAWNSSQGGRTAFGWVRRQDRSLHQARKGGNKSCLYTHAHYS